MPDRLPERLRADHIPTPLGEALLITDETGCLRGLDWTDCEARLRQLLRHHYGNMAIEPGKAPAPMHKAFRDYFAGDVHALGGIEWRTNGTPFQRGVWTALTMIPPGQTMSYGALAAKLGRPQAVRAVGHANGANPISLVVPCHRVIGSDGSLTGYGGGLHRKQWLLEHERAALSQAQPASARSRATQSAHPPSPPPARPATTRPSPLPRTAAP